MWRFFRSTGFNISVGVILIAAGSLLYTYTYNENIFSYGINMTVVPIQSFFSDIWKSADEIIPKLKSTWEMEQEIADLKLEVRNLRSLTADYYDLKKQNRQYSKYLELKKERSDLKFVAALAIGRDPEELFYGFTINRGTESGVSAGDCVITENGLVGCVYQSEENASRVRTILSPDIKIGAYDNISGDSGVISGNLELSDQGLTSLTLIQSQNSIKEGDIVTSAGLSGMYPKSLKVGKVKAVNFDNLNATNYAIIEPFENIKSVRDVLVVTSFQGKGEISQNVIQSNLEK